MNVLTVIKGIGRVISNPLGIRGDWGVEPWRSFELKREQIAKDNDLHRQIEVLTAQKRFKEKWK